MGLYFILIRLGSSPNKFHPIGLARWRIWPFPRVYCKKVPGLPPTRAQLARTPFTNCNTEYIAASKQRLSTTINWQLQAAVHRRSHCPLLNFWRPPPRLLPILTSCVLTWFIIQWVKFLIKFYHHKQTSSCIVFPSCPSRTSIKEPATSSTPNLSHFFKFWWSFDFFKVEIYLYPPENHKTTSSSRTVDRTAFKTQLPVCFLRQLDWNWHFLRDERRWGTKIFDNKFAPSSCFPSVSKPTGLVCRHVPGETTIMLEF